MEYITAGGVCCDTKMDRNCPPTLRRMDILVQIGFPGHVFEDLWQPGFRVSNVTRYHVVTRTEERAHLPPRRGFVRADQILSTLQHRTRSRTSGPKRRSRVGGLRRPSSTASASS